MAKKKKEQSKPKGVRITNRRAMRDFHILEVLECGIQLLGTEVKSLRSGQAKIDEAYVRLDGNELFLVGANIALYPLAGDGMQHVPTRKRRLLVHRRQIEKLQLHVKQKGKTLIPLVIYFHHGWVKVEIGVAEGIRSYDKRDSLRKKDQQRDMDRAMHRRQAL